MTVLRGLTPTTEHEAAMITPKTAMHVLQTLISGHDPISGEPLPYDSVLNRADVLRALLAGLSAIQETQTRAERRALLPAGVGRSWTDEEQAQLIAEFKADEPVEDIAAKHERTVRAIEARLERVGLLKAEDRTTAGGFSGSARRTKK